MMKKSKRVAFSLVSLFFFSACGGKSALDEASDNTPVADPSSSKTDSGTPSSGGGANNPGTSSKSTTTASGKTKVKAAEPENVPGLAGSLAIEFPDSVAKKNGAKASLRGFGLVGEPGEGGAGTPPVEGGGTSGGFYYLQEAAAQLESQVNEISLEMLKLDAIYKEVEAACGAAWTTCQRSAGAHQIKVTQPMVAAFLSAQGLELNEDNELVVGDKEFDPSKLSSDQAAAEIPVDSGFFTEAKALLENLKSGQTLPSPKIKLSKLSPANDKGCDIEYLAELSPEETVSVCWSNDQTKVYSERNELYRYKSSDAATSDDSSNALQTTIFFDSKIKKMVSTDSTQSVMGKDISSFKRSFTATASGDENQTVTGVLTTDFETNSESEGSSGLAGKVTSEFSLGKKGGYIKSTYNNKEVQISANTTSGLTDAMNFYNIAPSNASAASADWGSFLGGGSGTGRAELENLYYSGPVPAPQGLKLFTADSSGEEIKFVDSGLTVDLTPQVSWTKTSFEEAFDENGDIVYLESCDSQNNCTTIKGDELGAQAYASDFNAEFQEYEATQTKVTISSTTSSALKGEYLYFVAQETDLTNYDPASGDYFEKQLGSGWYNGDFENLSTTDTAGYELAWWGKKEQIANAKVYTLSADPATGEVKFNLVVGATLSSEN